MTARLRPLAAVALILAVTTLPASAQYFGQNKVQYERFPFQVLRTESFDIYHYPEEATAVAYAARLAEQWRARLGRELGFGLPGRQPLVLYASHPHFTQTQAISGLLNEGTGGVTESLKRRMVLPFGSTLGETSHVLGHEMVHAFQYGLGAERIGGLPLWFIEGMAEYASLGDDHPHTAMWLRDAAQEEEVPGLQDLGDPRYFPYRYGHAAWAWLTSRFGSAIVGEAFIKGARTGDVVAALQNTTGQSIDELSAEWKAAIRARHGDARDGAQAGRPLIADDSPRGGGLNVAPALSPDGTQLAYLSARGVFSVDLYIADAATGKVVRRLTRTDTDPHIESLQFIASAGAWDAAGQRFAYASVTRGTAVLTVVDVAARGGDRTFPVPLVDEAWHPAWSPDGRTIAFAGLAGGTSDLYLLELGGGTVRRLTSDAFADLQPAFSPDGRRIAFVTDRFSSSLDALTFGPTRLGLLTVDGGAIEALPPLADGKHINPQWDADGRGLFLIAEPDGVSNVYHLDLTTRAYARVTDVATGVSGITELSPALSYAVKADRIAFSVFRRGGYDIRVLDAPARQAQPFTASARPSVSRLFASRASTITAGRDLEQAGPPVSAAPAVDVSQVEPYRPALSLDIAGASGGVGASSRYGAMFGGGIGLQFSDMLGDHTLGVLVSANGGVRDIGGQVTYINRASRWNWGGAALVLPYVTGAFGQTIEQTTNGQLVVREQEYLTRQTDAELVGIAAYPFSRALRFEVQGGGRRIWFGRELTTRTYDYGTGQQLSEDREDFAAPEALNLAEGTAALVYDQSVFGPTSPINGQRYRFEVTPTFGSLRFTSLSLDYRRYLTLFRPLTLAVRGLHLGRYGGDAEDGRLSPLFLGYPSLMRGYGVGSFDTLADCGATLDGRCAAFDTLLGSRMLVGNAELRFPLFGVFSREYRYGPIPIEGFLFGDAGVAWTSVDDPSFAGGSRDFARSAGAGVRVNAFGYAVVELAAARPLDRPGRGWMFSFNLLPGF